MTDAAKPASSSNIDKSSINKASVQNAELDLAGFRVGKQRLVSKKKKTSTLKKLIVAEREVRSLDTDLLPSVPLPNQTSIDSLSHLSVDAPEFVPMGWVSNSEVDAPKDALTADASTAPKQDSRRQQGRMTTAVPEFVPSWCQPVAASSDVDLQGLPSDVSASQPSKTPAVSASQANKAQATSMTDLPVNEAIERVKVQSDKSKSKAKEPKKPKPQATTLEVRHYVHQVLNDELDEKVKAMLGELVRFQERARERDPLKYQKQKRFCVGMREASRSVTRGKAKCLIMAPNMEQSQVEGGLDDTVEDIIDLCREHEVPVVFALSRNRMGKALGKNIRLSIICILSAEGVHQEFKQIVKLTDELRKQWVMRKMALGVQGLDEDESENEDEDEKGETDVEKSEGLIGENDENQHAAEHKQVFGGSISERVKKHLEDKKAEEEKKRAEEKAKRDAERAVEKARKAEERRARQEERKRAQREEEEAQKEEERKKLEEEEAREAAKKEAELQAAERQAELLRKEKERRAEEERKRKEEQAARAAQLAALQKQQLASATANDEAEDDEDDDDDDDEDLPMGFNADFF